MPVSINFNSKDNFLYKFKSDFFLYFSTGAMMSVDDTLMCSFQILKPADKRKFQYGGLNAGRPVTPPRGANNKNKKK